MSGIIHMRCGRSFALIKLSVRIKPSSETEIDEISSHQRGVRGQFRRTSDHCTSCEGKSLEFEAQSPVSKESLCVIANISSKLLTYRLLLI